jgi:hypothetical protein
MKRLLIILSLVLLTVSIQAQHVGLFRPVPKTLFTETPGVLNAPQNASVWLWRLNANLVADEMTWDKSTKQFNSVPLSGMGPGIGFHHFTELQDGSPYNDWGVNFLVLIGTDIEHVTPANLKAALTVNAFDIFNIGVDTNFKTVGILFGVSVSFQ